MPHVAQTPTCRLFVYLLGKTDCDLRPASTESFPWSSDPTQAETAKGLRESDLSFTRLTAVRFACVKVAVQTWALAARPVDHRVRGHA